MRRRIHAYTVANVLALSRRKRRGIPASQDRIAMYTPDLYMLGKEKKRGKKKMYTPDL